ncbi:hypothetical protein QNH98_16415 [Myroides sp. mNGS23_01]|nr:hypothetical protein [Myroides sp. mNGS23_01]WHT38566.1 hypothetical protein QNH98_16415 [Myroides sp. mNGS23_01]
MKKTLLILFVVCLNYLAIAQETELSGLFIRPSLQEAKSKATMNFNPTLNFDKDRTSRVYHNVLSKNYTLFYVYKEKNITDSVAVVKRELPFIEMHFNGRIYKATSSFFLEIKNSLFRLIIVLMGRWLIILVVLYR